MEGRNAGFDPKNLEACRVERESFGVMMRLRSYLFAL